MGTVDGVIFNIQRLSVHDGPGIRTTVFLKGCPLNCMWCHNPESKQKKPQVNTAGETVGYSATVDDIMHEVIRDLSFYKQSGGGMTLSGGEPLYQADFTLALLQAAKAQGIHTCVETSGYASYSTLRRILPYTDLFLYDWKETNEDRHTKYTGVSNATICKNLIALDASGAASILRCPIIPGYNDNTEHYMGIAALANSLHNIKAVNILPYHTMGSHKAETLGQVYQLSAVPPLSQEATAVCVDTIRGYVHAGVDVS